MVPQPAQTDLDYYYYLIIIIITGVIGAYA